MPRFLLWGLVRGGCVCGVGMEVVYIWLVLLRFCIERGGVGDVALAQSWQARLLVEFS